MFQFKRKKYQSFSDEMLVLQYKNDADKLCFSILYERYAHLVLGVGLKYLKDGPTAEDLASHVFEKLIDMLHKHDITNFKSWLYMVSKNECLMFLRKQKKPIPTELQELASEESETDYELHDSQLNILQNKLGILKEEQKRCIELFYIKELSYNEISQELKLPIKQVKSAIQNGKRNLKILLEQENEFKH